METSDNIQRELLQAVNMNDVAKASSLLELSQDDEITLDINAQFGNHTPLIAAIAAKNIEMTSLLLKHGAKSDDALFYCIDVESEALVRVLCEHYKAISPECLGTTLSTICTDSNFKPVSNPLIFATRANRHELVKVLIEYGATLPDLQTILDHAQEDPYEEYLACYSWHQANSSEAYLLHASNDPLQAAIDAGKAILKIKSAQQNHLQSDYEELMAQLDQFVANCFAMTGSEHEISALLWKGQRDNNNDDNVNKVGVVPQSVQDVLRLDYKQFISSTACQQFILDQWYMRWKHLSGVSFLFWTAMVVVFQPILCLAYMILPFKNHRLIMKTPYVRFLVHWVSRIYFICLIVYHTASMSNLGSFTEEKYQRIHLILEFMSSPPSTVVVLAYVWILGMTWREIRELWSNGCGEYLKDPFNYSDILQLVLYWAALVCHMVSFVERQDVVRVYCNGFTYLAALQDMSFSIDLRSFNEPTAIFTTGVCSKFATDDTFERLLREDNNSAMSMSASSTQEQAGEQDASEARPEQLTFPFRSDDPALLGDVFFGIATVLSCLALLRDLVMVGFVGPLRAAFGGLLSDIGRFLILFIFVWISFALGMTQLYVTYDLIEMANCYDKREEDGCSPSVFGSLQDSLSALFWSLFNPLREDELRIKQEYKMTFAVGEALYAIYMVVAVVVMLNALIAMMSNTYTRVEENAEVEWKVARTNLMVGYMTTSATLPPPFNLLPTLRMVRNWISAFCRRIRKCCSSDQYKATDKTDIALERHQDESYEMLMKTLVDRYIRSYVDTDCENTDDLKQELADVKDSLKKLEGQMEIILQHVQGQRTTHQRNKSAKELFFK